ncbi:MAG: DeoR family transcriptional regulator [Clostridia bacterium]|nr:DeoR family transcriptional regulator [Clostridia bacterium]
MQKTVERRQMILEVLCERRFERIDNLAAEFNVSRRTVRYDIEVLSYSYPIYTSKGTGGGIHIVDGFKLGMKYLTKEQADFLESILHNYSDKEKEILVEILNTFKMPEIKNGTK